jgi:transcriptional regulator with XRE-family HTH domain
MTTEEKNMLTLEQVQQLLQDRRLDIISKSTGIAIGTVSNVRDGKRNPRYTTLKALSDYLEGQKNAAN